MLNLGVAPEELARAFDVMAQAGKEGGFELKDMAAEFPSIAAAAQAMGMTGAAGLADIAAALQIVRKGNLAYRWFCGLGLEDRIPNHSVFSRARSERFRDSNLLRTMFEHVVMSCIDAGLVGGHSFAVDASLIQADANKQRSIPGPNWNQQRNLDTASRAVKEYVETLDDAAFGAASDAMPKFVSPSDPASQWTGAHKGPAFFA